MKKVILWDKSILFIKDEQLAGVERNLEKAKGFWLNHAGGRDFLAKGSIARITNGGPDAPVKVDESRQLAAPNVPVDKNSKGYRAYMSARKKLTKRLALK